MDTAVFLEKRNGLLLAVFERASEKNVVSSITVKINIAVFHNVPDSAVLKQ